MAQLPSTGSTLLTLAPYHLLIYSSLLGSTLYQTFLVTKITFKTLPMSAFTTLQKRLFPAYFRTQSILTLATALTFPPYGPVSLLRASWINSAALSFAIAMAGLNLVVYGPRTEKAMIEVTHQATKDAAATSYNSRKAEPSLEMKQKKRNFSKNHAMSIHLNLLAIGATLFYGVRLARCLQIEGP